MSNADTVLAALYTLFIISSSAGRSSACKCLAQKLRFSVSILTLQIISDRLFWVSEHSWSSVMFLWASSYDFSLRFSSCFWKVSFSSSLVLIFLFLTLLVVLKEFVDFLWSSSCFIFIITVNITFYSVFSYVSDWVSLGVYGFTFSSFIIDVISRKSCLLRITL